MVDNTELNPGSGGDNIATDDISGIKYQRTKPVIGPEGCGEGGGDIHKGNAFPVIPGMSSPTMSHTTSAALASGGSTDLDSAQISSGLTGKLAGFLATSSVPLKVELKTVLNGAESAVRLTVFPGLAAEIIILPSKNFVTQVESATPGLDGFRLTVTNLDTTQAADVYGTFFYDEE